MLSKKMEAFMDKIQFDYRKSKILNTQNQIVYHQIEMGSNLFGFPCYRIVKFNNNFEMFNNTTWEENNQKLSLAQIYSYGESGSHIIT